MSISRQTNLINDFNRNFRRLAGCPEKQESGTEVWGEREEQLKLLHEARILGWTVKILAAFIIGMAILVLAIRAEAQEVKPAMPSDYYIENERIVEAIYIAEGGAKAKKPFGILSVPCNSYQECRQICLNTVRNNKKRYADYGHKTHESFIEFLASRYAPVGVSNDPKGLNRHWIKNVMGSL